MRHMKIETAADGFATLTLDNADESMNLVSDAFIADMIEATAQIAADDGIKGVILTSGKPAFMAGADLKLLVQGYETMTLKTAFAFSQKASAMHRAIETSGKAWVAVMNGLALGGGFELALACHYRVLVDDPKAVVGLPEVNVGLLPGSGGTQRLIRIAGMKIGTELLLSGRAVKGAEALALGIVDCCRRRCFAGHGNRQRPSPFGMGRTGNRRACNPWPLWLDYLALGLRPGGPGTLPQEKGLSQTRSNKLCDIGFWTRTIMRNNLGSTDGAHDKTFAHWAALRDTCKHT